MQLLVLMHCVALLHCYTVLHTEQVDVTVQKFCSSTRRLNMELITARSPQQHNGYDCGVYVLGAKALMPGLCLQP